MLHFQLLGQSNFGLAIVLDTLAAMYPDQAIRADVVANLPAEANSSLAFSFDTPGVTCHTFEWGAEWLPLPDVPCLLGSVGRGRQAIFAFFEKKYHLPTSRYGRTIHPSAVVSPSAALGHGVHISPLSVVAPHATLGHFVVINRSASVGHHTQLADFVAINPGATVAGCCRLGAGVTIGAGAVVIDQISIGEGSVIGAGSVVTRDLPAGVVAYGNPARVVREVGG
jgi:sugar O-acyltransferase (sialic acid O-acetyltransferase NeuD family)